MPADLHSLSRSSPCIVRLIIGVRHQALRPFRRSSFTGFVRGNLGVRGIESLASIVFGQRLTGKFLKCILRPCERLSPALLVLDPFQDVGRKRILIRFRQILRGKDGLLKHWCHRSLLLGM